MRDLNAQYVTLQLQCRNVFWNKVSRSGLLPCWLQRWARLTGKQFYSVWMTRFLEMFSWEDHPFGINESSNLSAEEEKQLIDLRNDRFFQALLPQNSLDEFWWSARKSYSVISVKAIKIILPFASPWLCEYGFSALTEIKSEKRERLLGIDDKMQVCLATTEPRFNLTCSQKQAHLSHSH